MQFWNELQQRLRQWRTLLTTKDILRVLSVAIPCVTIVVALSILLTTCGKPQTTPATPPTQPGLKPVSRDISVDEVSGTVSLLRGDAPMEISRGLVISDGDALSLGADGRLRLTLDATDKRVSVEENTALQITAQGRLGSTQTDLGLTQGGVLCQLDSALKETERFTVQTPAAGISSAQGVFRVSMPGAAQYTLVEVFSGSASVTCLESGSAQTLRSGQCALVCGGQSFATEGSLSKSFWRSGDAWDGQIAQDATGSTALPIPYEKLPAGTLEELTRILDGGKKLILSRETVQNLLESGHDYRETVEKAPSCTQKGSSSFHCALCGDTYREESPAIGHTPVQDEGYPATCTKPGRTDGSHCSVCNEVIEAQKTIEALGHTLEIKEGRPATCTQDGMTEGKRCTVCGEVLSVQTAIPATGHKVVIDAAAEATCYTEGRTQGSHCEVCGEVLKEQQILPMLPHTPVVDAAVEATCTQEGLTEGSHCEVCGEVLTRQEHIPKKEHTVVIDLAVAPTDTQPGLTEGSHCSVCGTVLTQQQTVPPIPTEPPTEAPTEPATEAATEPPTAPSTETTALTEPEPLP